MSEPRRPSAEEREAAQARKERLEAELRRKRLRYGLGFMLCVACASAVAAYGPVLVAYSMFGLGAIALVHALDAHSHLQSIRQRPAVSLIPDFSVLSAVQSEKTSSALTDR